MSDESFLLVSLKENQAKKLAQVISNETCRKILDHLSKKEETTESEIAKDLNIPASTVHYNLQHLRDNQLVEVEEFHYSKKGKEVNHYKLANKLIIIAPKESDELKQKLRRFFPLGILAIAVTAIINFFPRFFPNFLTGRNTFAADAAMKGGANVLSRAVPERVVAEAAVTIANKSAPLLMNSAVEEAVDELAVETTNQAVQTLTSQTAAEQAATVHAVASPYPMMALWFFLGVLFAVIIYIIIDWYLIKKDK